MLKGKTVIVTGGSRGIGREISLECGRCGANVAIIYAGNSESAEKTVNEITALGANAKSYKCDVKYFDLTKDTVAQILNDFGTVDVLVNNAGIIRDNLVLAMKEEDYDNVLDTNLKGSFNMIKHLYPHFMKKRSGRIINISSISGIAGNAGQANYSSSKAGMIGLTKAVAKELAGRNVTCNTIAPGFIKTDLTENVSEAQMKKALESIPLKRMGEPSDIAKMAVYLASENGKYITGAVIRVDGGLSM